MNRKSINNLNLREKYDIVNLHENKTPVKIIASIFKCGKTQVYNAIKNKDDIIKRYLSNRESSTSKKKYRSGNVINDLVFDWYCLSIAENFPINGPILCSKAREFARQFGNTEFKASNGWLECFKKKHNISFKSNCDVVTIVRSETLIEDWRSKLDSLCDGYDRCNIANCDETALYYKALPYKTSHFIGKECNNNKYANERITLLVTIFGDGKIYKPLAVGKCKNPNSFQKLDMQRLPFTYYASQNALMTRKIFSEYLDKLNTDMIMQNRQIILFMDNASVHFTETNYSNINIKYLPPNSTRILQPINTGVMQHIKALYRRTLLQHLLNIKDQFDDITELVKNLSFLECMLYLADAVNCVRSKTITRCFAKCSFGFEVLKINSDDLSIKNCMKSLQEIIEIFETDCYTADEYSELEKDIEIGEEYDDDCPTSEISENMDEDEVCHEVNVSDALKSFRMLTSFAAQIGNDELLKAMTKSQLSIIKSVDLNKKFAQSKLTDYFIFKN